MDTGHNDKFAYGYYTRRVMTIRKGKEGNDAFLDDSGINNVYLNSYDGITLNKNDHYDTTLFRMLFMNQIYHLEIDEKTLDKLFLKI